MSYDEVMRLAIERGFLLPSCEIYSDALAGFWDWGPLGAGLKNRFTELWRRELVRRDEMIEIDGSQIMSRSVFAASGHLDSFVDPIVSCDRCGSTHRADRLIQEKSGQIVPERLDESQLDQMLSRYGLVCPACGGGFGKVRKFNLMFRVGVGVKDEDSYLRPETCQSIFVDFPRLFKVMRCKLPAAFAQYGKSFRNEISPRQGLMRLREFYQAEIEVFFNPAKAGQIEKFEEVKDYPLRLCIDGEAVREVVCGDGIKEGILPSKLIAYYLAVLQQFYEKTGVDMSRTRFRQLGVQEKAFYASSAFDLEVQTSLGWVELVACNYRTDYDLGVHFKLSREDMTVLDGEQKVLPHVFELSMGVDRSLYCILEHAYHREPERVVLRMKPYLTPTAAGVFPLVSKGGLPEKAKSIYDSLKRDFDLFYDESGSIGRRYRRVDEIGVPVCITIDYQTLQDDTVTLRDRDSMKQTRVKVADLQLYLQRLLRGEDIFR